VEIVPCNYVQFQWSGCEIAIFAYRVSVGLHVGGEVCSIISRVPESDEPHTAGIAFYALVIPRSAKSSGRLFDWGLEGGLTGSLDQEAKSIVTIKI